MTLNAEIVEAGFNTAVGTAAHTDLELVGELYVIPTKVVPLVDLACERLCVKVTVNAGRTLAGGNGTDLCTRAAEDKGVSVRKSLGFLDLFKRDAGDLD